MNEEPQEIPVEPNPFWRRNAENLVGESISTIEDVAKQLIAVNSILEGIYFHAIAFSDIKPVMNTWIAVLYLVPIALWLFSLVFAVWTLSPRQYDININSSHNSKKRFEEILLYKHKLLKISEGFLIFSFIALFAAVMHYLLTIPRIS